MLSINMQHFIYLQNFVVEKIDCYYPLQFKTTQMILIFL